MNIKFLTALVATSLGLLATMYLPVARSPPTLCPHWRKKPYPKMPPSRRQQFKPSRQRPKGLDALFETHASLIRSHGKALLSRLGPASNRTRFRQRPARLLRPPSLLVHQLDQAKAAAKTSASPYFRCAAGQPQRGIQLRQQPLLPHPRSTRM